MDQSITGYTDDSNFTSPVLVFDNVHMVFKRGVKKPVQALRGMDLTIPSGAVVGLLGPNGCGKTTALSCMLGLLFPQNGEISLWGKPVEKASVQDKTLLVGAVLEDTRLPPFLTVKKLLSLVCEMRRIPGAQVKNEMERVISITGIEPLLDLRINALSKGQARKVSVATALTGDPPLLVMDEPASGLDVSARIEFNNLVRRLRDGKRTILITSHLLSDIENTCTHIAIMLKGEIMAFDKTGHLIDAGGNDEIDIFIHEKHMEVLNRLGLSFSSSEYRQLVALDLSGRPDYEILGLLAANQIAPKRIEPRDNLITYYLSVTENEE